MWYGSGILYYENGTIQAVENYINGKSEGRFTAFDEDGTIFAKSCFEDGIETKIKTQSDMTFTCP